MRRFREEFLGTSTRGHLHVGDPCVTCALYDIFSALNSASTDTKVQAVAPTSLRIALSNLYPNSNFFQEVCLFTLIIALLIFGYFWVFLWSQTKSNEIMLYASDKPLSTLRVRFRGGNWTCW